MKRGGIFILGFLAAAPISLILVIVWKWLNQ